MNKVFALVLVLIFLTSLVAIQPATVEAAPDAIVVPDDYPTVSSAIGNATDGDKIFVKSGTYIENTIKTNKSLSIMGESYQSTIINFETSGYEVDVSLYEKYYFHDPAMIVTADNFRLSGFTINSNGGEISVNGNNTQVTANNIGTTFDISGSNLFVTGNVFSKLGIFANYSKISSNVITNGVSLGGQYDIFSSNSITNSAPTIETNNCLIYDNNVFNASFAIFPLTGKDNIVSHNTIDHLATGLWVRGSNNIVLLNQITHCGVALLPSPNNAYYANQIANNLWGMDTVGSLLNPDGNTGSFFNNNMNNNVYQVNTLFASKADYFDKGKEGNYWSDYHGVDANDDGIGDTPFLIDANRSYRYPLITPFNISNVPDLIPDWALPPSIELINPTNTTYPIGNVTLNFFIGKEPLWIGYSLDGQQNITITGNNTINSLTNGIHNITVYVNNTFGSMGVSQTVAFAVAKSEPFPTPTVAIISGASAVVVVSASLLGYFTKRRQRNSQVSMNLGKIFHNKKGMDK